MTTKFLDNQIFTFNLLVFRGASHEKLKFLDAFPLCRQGPPLKKRKKLFLLSSRCLCEDQRFPAKICVPQMLCFLREGEKISENLRTSTFGLSLSPQVRPLKCALSIGTGKRGHYERGLFTGETSRVSKITKFSRVSRKWTFLKRPLFRKTPFSEPESRGATSRAQ